MKTPLMKAFPRQRLLRFSGALLLVSLLTLVGATQAPIARRPRPSHAGLDHLGAWCAGVWHCDPHRHCHRCDR